MLADPDCMNLHAATQRVEARGSIRIGVRIRMTITGPNDDVLVLKTSRILVESTEWSESCARIIRTTQSTECISNGRQPSCYAHDGGHRVRDGLRFSEAPPMCSSSKNNSYCVEAL